MMTGVIATVKKTAKRLALDGWENVVTGLGRSRDKRTANQISTPVMPASRDEYDDFFHSDHTAQKIARLPAREMTRKWITIQVDDSVDEKMRGPDAAPAEKMLTAKQIMQALEDLSAQSVFAEAITWARVHGGACIFMGVNDGADELSEPLDMDNIKSVDFLTVFDRWELVPREWATSLKNKDEAYGEPTLYELIPQTASGYVSLAGEFIHASRLIRFDGTVTSRYQASQNMGWAHSVYTSMRETLSDYGMTWHGVAHLLVDFAQAVFKMHGLNEALLAQEGQLVIDRLTALDMCRSVARAIPLDAEAEDFMRVTTPLGGLADVIDRFMLRVSEAAEIPATLLFGQSPAGLNATGESDIRLFYDGISARQETELRPRLDRLLDVLLASTEGPTKGKAPENWSYDFVPLWQESDKERAETRKTQAEADDLYISQGVLSPDEVAMSRFGGDTYSTDTVLDMEARTAGMVAMPDEPTELVAGAEGLSEPQGEAIQAAEALNGAQVTALIQVVQEYNAGTLAKQTAFEIIKAAFPIDEPVIVRMLEAKPEKPEPEPIPTVPAVPATEPEEQP